MSYYTGDSVPLAFNITDKDGAINPSSVQVDMLKPGNIIVLDCCPAVIDGNEVSCVVPGTCADRQGLYKVYFVNLNVK